MYELIRLCEHELKERDKGTRKMGFHGMPNVLKRSLRALKRTGKELENGQG